MKRILKFSLLVTVVALFVSSCSRNTSSKSSLTGWDFNSPKYGNFLKGESKGQLTPPGMVPIEGGTFTMGAVQDDVMFDWNTTPRQMHVRSFYMDETEVTNSEYGLFVQYIKKVYPPEEKQYEKIYESVLPDTLVWRKGLGNTDLLSESYFRHPSYSEYPVVGVSWMQANRYCQWRTDAVNLNELIKKGVITRDLFSADTIPMTGADSFNTDVYLEDPNRLFAGDTTVYKRGLPVPRKKGDPRPSRDQFSGRHVTSTDGILVQKFRLPTEAEWEYAAKADIENREYNTVRGKKKYAWNDGNNTRDKRKRYRGDQLANYKQGAGDYSGISGWSSDGSDIPIAVRSYPPNAFGLYDMSGNVAEWVADVYRPIVDSEANDFNYFRGNMFTKKMIGEDGKVVIVKNDNVEYDTLENGKIVPKDLPGNIRYIPISEKDVYMRRNYTRSNNANLKDGDYESSRLFSLDDDQRSTADSKMYNSPEKPEEELDSVSGKKLAYDAKRRTTLISDKTRVYKGGSWADREYWLDPAQRRYFPQYMATNFIGFRCATDRVGSMTDKKRKPRSN